MHFPGWLWYWKIYLRLLNIFLDVYFLWTSEVIASRWSVTLAESQKNNIVSGVFIFKVYVAAVEMCGGVVSAAGWISQLLRPHTSTAATVYISYITLCTRRGGVNSFSCSLWTGSLWLCRGNTWNTPPPPPKVTPHGRTCRLDGIAQHYLLDNLNR